MRVHEASATIEATPEAVWAVLVDGAAYPQWDPNVERVEGRIAAGERIKVFTKLQPGRAFPVQVSAFEPPARMVWSGGMPLGLFRGVRTFTLTREGEARTRIHTREEFRGPLLPLIGRSIPDLNPSFQQFVAGLKRRAEGHA